MNLLEKLPQHLLDKIKNLKKLLSPYTSRAYLVGGGVRDIFMGIEVYDLDIEVYDIEPKLFDSLMQKWGAKGVGKSFFIYKLDDIDLAMPRLESKVSSGHRGFNVSYCNDSKEASKRRDFTMNAMMLNIFDGKLLDYWGGQEDIKLRTLRLIDKQSFCEDPLRVLRGVQFAARFGCIIDSFTCKVMDEMNLDELSHTRVFWEFEKLFKAQHLHLGLLYMYKLNLFEKLLSVKVELKDLQSVAVELEDCKPYFEEHLRPYYFLYFLVNRLTLNMKEILDKLEAPNHYYKALHVPFEEEGISDERLAHLAIDRPLCEWVGLCRKGLKERAERLGVYKEAFTGGVSSKEVIDDGFKGKEIGKEMRRRKEEKAKELF